MKMTRVIMTTPHCKYSKMYLEEPNAIPNTYRYSLNTNSYYGGDFREGFTEKSDFELDLKEVRVSFSWLKNFYPSSLKDIKPDVLGAMRTNQSMYPSYQPDKWHC